jgi:hypothetical protein
MHTKYSKTNRKTQSYTFFYIFLRLAKLHTVFSESCQSHYMLIEYQMKATFLHKIIVKKIAN